MKRGQASAEAFIILGVLLVLAIVLVYIYSARYTEIEREKDRVRAQDFVNTLASNADYAYLLGPNTSLSVYFPSLISGNNYTLTFGKHFIVLSQGYTVVSATSVAPLNSSLSVPTDFAIGATRNIVYTGDMVTIQ